MSGDLVDRARESRKSGAVLKVLLSNIRSRDTNCPVLVFEGVDDYGPYRVWIARIRDSLRYERLCASGKDQVLEFRARLREDKNNLGEGVYFFVDRDYDDLKGHTSDTDLFCTDMYSIENYLVSTRVMESVLTEEFRCPAGATDMHRVLAIFTGTLEKFNRAMKAPNRRMFQARRLGIRGRTVTDPVGKYVRISLNDVVASYTESDLTTLIQLEREPTQAEVARLDEEFNRLDPITRHRGKFLIQFFYQWLTLLAEERRRGVQALFSDSIDVRFSAQKLPFDSLASRSDLPSGLARFVEEISN